MKMMLLLATTLAALGSPLQAQAQEGQSVWRCGADGRSYSATPCAEGIGGGAAQAAQALKPAAAPKKQRQSPKHRLALQPGDDGIWQAVGPASRRKKG